MSLHIKQWGYEVITLQNHMIIENNTSESLYALIWMGYSIPYHHVIDDDGQHYIVRNKSGEEWQYYYKL